MVTFLPPAFSWESQAKQYAYRGEPGLNWEKHSLGVLGDLTEVDCLLMRDEDGILIAILNYYLDGNNPWEEEGNVNLWVRPDRQRRGLGTAMLAAAMKKYKIIFAEQRYTADGWAMIQRLRAKGVPL